MSNLKTTEEQAKEAYTVAHNNYATGEDDSGLHCTIGMALAEDALEAHRLRRELAAYIGYLIRQGVASKAVAKKLRTILDGGPR